MPRTPARRRDPLLAAFGRLRHAASPRRSARLGAHPLGLGALLLLSATASAQAPGGVERGVAPRDSGGVVASDGRVFGRRELVVLAAFAFGATVSYQNDRGIARAFQRPSVQDDAALRHTAAVFRSIGQPGVLVGGLAAYGIGRAAHRPVVATAGLRVSEGIAVAGILTAAGKFVAGRSRPFVTEGARPDDFHLWGGDRRGYTSMPSGHTSAAFAAASALAVEWRAFAPRSARLAIPLLYTGATLVGASRLYHNRHWASDVVAGAALGTLAGGGVARRARAHPGNAIERHLLALRLQPGPAGIGLAYSWQPGRGARGAP